MTNGMKGGAGSDPFADDDVDTAGEEEADATPADTEETADRSRRSDPPTEDQEAETLPYIFERDGVKADRKMIQFFLRDEAQRLEDDLLQDVEADLGADVYRTDLREALVHVAAEHPEEVADELREWGYRFKE